MFVRDCPDLVQKRVTVEEKDCFSERELTFFEIRNIHLLVNRK